MVNRRWFFSLDPAASGFIESVAIRKHRCGKRGAAESMVGPRVGSGVRGLVEWEFRGVKRLVWVSVGVGGCLSGVGWGSWSEWE